MNNLIQKIVNEVKLQIFTEEEKGDKQVIAIYPGRFQPMGRHHKLAYDWLAKQFGVENTYVVTSDKTEPQRSPLNFAEKKAIMNKHGIKNVAKIRMPYLPTELLQKFDPNKTVIVYMIGEKDKGRLSGYKRLMKYNKTTLVPYKDIQNPYAYYVYAPHISVQIPSFGEMSGTNIRKALGDREAKLSELKQRFKDIMGWFDPKIFNTVIAKMNSRRSKIVEHVDDWMRSFLNMTDIQAKMFFDIVQKEYGDTKDLMPILRKFISGATLSEREKVMFQKQMKDTLKLLGLGAIAAIPIPGTMLLIPVVVQLAKKFNINLLPENNEPNGERLSIVRREFWDKVFEEVVKEEDGIDFVLCNECGDKMKQIQYRHLKYKHNMTLDEYTAKYPGAKLVCESAKNYGDKNPMNIPGVREKQKDALNTPEMKQLFAEKSRNRPVLEETRIKCSINNSMNDLENRKKVSERLKEVYSKNSELIETRRKHFTKIRNSEFYKERMVELGFWRKEDDIPKYEKYVNAVRKLTNENYRKYFYEIKNAKDRSRENHLDHKISIYFGFENNLPVEIIAHHCNLEVIPSSLNESKHTANSIRPNELYESIITSTNPIDARQLLTCGGAAGHMRHLFDDMELTFGDLKNMFKLGLSGKITTISNPSEKLDGQNLLVTFKNNQLYAARNKGDIIDGGMTYDQVVQKFEGRGEIQEAFSFAVKDLQNAIMKLSQRQQKLIFKNGKAWMNLEIMYPKSTNVINYDGAYLVFHGSSVYNKRGEKVEEHPEYARILAGMIQQVNANTQEVFSIEKPKLIKVAKAKDYREKLKYFVSQLTALQRQMNCNNNDTISLWHQRWWERYIKSETASRGIKLPPQIINALIKRWAFYDKSFPINKNTMVNESAFRWAKEVEQTILKDQLKKNLQPFETLVLRFGAEVLKNVSDVMALNPKATTRKIKSDVQNAIDILSTSDNPNDLKVLKTQLERLKSAGGINAIVPLEGIAFTYNGKTYKLTGVFAPINQLLGHLKFKR